MNNPTLVVVTDRNDLDGQLYQQFCAAKDLLKQTPEQAESREQLREMLAARQSGGIIFTTIQKFSLESQESDHPVLCARSERLSPAPRSSRARTCAQFSLRESLGAGKTRKNAQTAPLRCTPACFSPFSGALPRFSRTQTSPGKHRTPNAKHRTPKVQRRGSDLRCSAFDVSVASPPPPAWLSCKPSAQRSMFPLLTRRGLRRVPSHTHRQPGPLAHTNKKRNYGNRHHPSILPEPRRVVG